MSDADARPEPDRRAGAPHPRETLALFGQDEAEARFLDALRSGRMHHAWLITGPQGVGKATLAWRMARYMLAGDDGDSLDMAPDHPVFTQVRALSAPALALCRRPWDDKARRLKTAITVDEVRALKGFFQLSAPDAAWRVAIVDAADEMTVSAANALLKMLEEPPPRALIVLVSHQPSRLLPTIRSRCRELRCRALAPGALSEALRQAGAEPAAEDAGVLAVLAAGSAGVALDLIAGGGLALYGDIVAAMLPAPPVDRIRAGALADACAGRNGQPRFDLTLDLLEIALARLARAGAGAETDPVSEAEGTLMARLAAAPHQGRLWAEHAQAMRARADHGRAVNLDPGQVILDTFLRIDKAAADAQRRVA